MWLRICDLSQDYFDLTLRHCLSHHQVLLRVQRAQPLLCGLPIRGVQRGKETAIPRCLTTVGDEPRDPGMWIIARLRWTTSDSPVLRSSLDGHYVSASLSDRPPTLDVDHPV